MKNQAYIIFLPLKQMKTEIGNVRIIKAMEPTVARISIKPPRCPSAGSYIAFEAIE